MAQPRGELLREAAEVGCAWSKLGQECAGVAGVGDVEPEHHEFWSQDTDVFAFNNIRVLTEEGQGGRVADKAGDVVYTDGSVSGVRGSWAAARWAVDRRDFCPADTWLATVPHGTDSYGAEQQAIKFGLLMVEDSHDAALLTDSLSNLASLKSHRRIRDKHEADIYRNLVSRAKEGKHTALGWIRGHRGTVGNEFADAAAGHALRITSGEGAYCARAPIPGYLARTWVSTAQRQRLRSVMRSATSGHMKRVSALFAGSGPALSPLLATSGHCRNAESAYSRLRLGIREASGQNISLAELADRTERRLAGATSLLISACRADCARGDPSAEEFCDKVVEQWLQRHPSAVLWWLEETQAWRDMVAFGWQRADVPPMTS